MRPPGCRVKWPVAAEVHEVAGGPLRCVVAEATEGCVEVAGGAESSRIQNSGREGWGEGVTAYSAVLERMVASGGMTRPPRWVWSFPGTSLVGLGKV
jgi:hypothetical protein